VRDTERGDKGKEQVVSAGWTWGGGESLGGGNFRESREVGQKNSRTSSREKLEREHREERTTKDNCDKVKRKIQWVGQVMECDIRKEGG